MVVLENVKGLAHDRAADTEPPGKLRLGGKQLVRMPVAGLDLLLQHFLQLVVQRHEAVPVDLLCAEGAHRF